MQQQKGYAHLISTHVQSSDSQQASGPIAQDEVKSNAEKEQQDGGEIISAEDREVGKYCLIQKLL